MRKLELFCLIVLLQCVSVAWGQSTQLALHSDNPHYFFFRDKPTVIISSGEHYGAVLNRDFDYLKYINELHEHGLNHSRLFSGAYVEPQGAFNIVRNTLAPAEGRFICPWERSDQPGYPAGGNKFDLSKFDEEYFIRLKDFVSKAGERGIIIEVTLFCPFYEEAQWALSPQNAVNNINNVGNVARTDVYTLDKHGGLLEVHERLVQMIVSELRNADNVYYEVCNEPYFGGVTMEWQHHIVDVIAASERDMDIKPHLISMNIANGSLKIEQPHPAVSIFNFHYASPPDAVAQNYGLNKVIGLNETGFKGTADTHYRMEAWEFLLAGGALYNNLDYSFAVDFEDGSFQYPDTQPGGGNHGFREQMRILKEFIDSLNFVRMKPAPEIVGKLPEGVRATVLAEEGQQYAVYVFGTGGKQLVLKNIPAGEYVVTRISPFPKTLNDVIVNDLLLRHPGGELSFPLGNYDPDIAFSFVRSKP